MALESWLTVDIGRAILAGVVLTIRTSAAHGAGNLEFVAGALTGFEHTAGVFGVSWPGVLQQARAQVGGNAWLLDAAAGRLEGLCVPAREG